MTDDAALLTVLRRDRAIVLGAIATLAALAWAYTMWLAANMDMMSGTTGAGTPMSGMPDAEMITQPDIDSWTPAEFMFMAVMWSVMMVGMMTPSAAPMILLYACVGRHASERAKMLPAVFWFVAGYLSAWIGFSLIATSLQWALTQLQLLTSMMATADAKLGGAILIAAGAYQLTPVKSACLKNRQAPLWFIQRHGGFRREPLGALRIGLVHGLYCIGCCWTLMALLFVGGVMNLLWIAGLALLALAEKMLPTGRLLSRTSGVALIAWGGWLVMSG
jgi:predicted metal-binding membrane protein